MRSTHTRLFPFPLGKGLGVRFPRSRSASATALSESLRGTTVWLAARVAHRVQEIFESGESHIHIVPLLLPNRRARFRRVRIPRIHDLRVVHVRHRVVQPGIPPSQTRSRQIAPSSHV